MGLIRKSTDKRLAHNKGRTHACQGCGKQISERYPYCYNCFKQREVESLIPTIPTIIPKHCKINRPWIRGVKIGQ